jgi:hypothetical protein
MILDAFGEDRVLWGTDSIWWGSPQWQIEAMKRITMPQELTAAHSRSERENPAPQRRESVQRGSERQAQSDLDGLH